MHDFLIKFSGCLRVLSPGSLPTKRIYEFGIVSPYGWLARPPLPHPAPLPDVTAGGGCGSRPAVAVLGSRTRCLAVRPQMEMSEDDNNMEEYPTEIHDYLTAFEKCLGSVDEMLKTMMSVSRSDLSQKLDPLEQAKLDLVSVYALNSMFWVYLATQGINPKEHPVKKELTKFLCLGEPAAPSGCTDVTSSCVDDGDHAYFGFWWALQRIAA
ncbi:nuclear nucleic acid-binding protein C1D isoform X3 [Haemorhous mexicanus]|uniref:nuclear nucleic acid-binding protein C1D isoform X3 n=1 Tax=Haemorhous mexicanus TaxID=30427 RepID=UPI0028BEB21F|nr:nuclear nucleic acid-binding protein C1D isoform X3 [Haemorhous mexicanus]